MENRKTALITGASRGIGLELAAIFAKNGNDLVLVARSEKDLKVLKRVYEEHTGVNVEIIVKDLTQKNAAKEVYDEVNRKNIQIDYLVNNAGFGDFAPFVDSEWDKIYNMIELNMAALTQFCHLYINQWRDKKIKGKILNVASTAAFQPGPLMAVYFATKSYVLHLSEALNFEVKENNISVTVLCPGPTETNFGKISNMNASDVMKNVRIASAKDVAETGYDALMKNKSLVIEGVLNRLVASSIGFLPRDLVTYLSGKIMRQSGK